ncbi:MAG: LptF/LptG family permease [bacterium]
MIFYGTNYFMILFRYILRNHFGPFIFSNCTLFAVLLLQFLMKIADNLVGKGLSFWVIFQLIIYSLSWMLVLVVPMSVLVATLMAFGGMAQNNEIAILKSSGISLYKMMIPPALGGIVVAFLLVQFNNYVYPNTNHMARLLMEDINRQKPTLALVPGVFSQDVQSYSILARDVDPLINELKDLTIYDNSAPPATNIVTAKNGKVFFSKDHKKLILDLRDGEIHESDVNKPVQYRKLIFEKHKIAIPAAQFFFEQSSAGGYRSERELGAQDMIVIVDSLEKVKENYSKGLRTELDKLNKKIKITEGKTSRTVSRNMKQMLLRVDNKIKSNKSLIESYHSKFEFNKRETNKFWVEIHKKYSLPFACIAFILIGAPLGTMVRKGGFGIAAGISLVFFLIYWTFLIGGEKLSDRGLLSPFLGMWSANILLLLLGIFLTIKSARETVILRFDFLKKLIPKQFRDLTETDENN